MTNNRIGIIIIVLTEPLSVDDILTGRERSTFRIHTNLRTKGTLHLVSDSVLYSRILLDHIIPSRAHFHAAAEAGEVIVGDLCHYYAKWNIRQVEPVNCHIFLCHRLEH